MPRYRIPGPTELVAIKKELRDKFGYSESFLKLSPRTLLYNLEFDRKQRRENVRKTRNWTRRGVAARPDLAARIRAQVTPAQANALGSNIDELRFDARRLIWLLVDDQLAQLTEQGLDKGLDLLTLHESINHMYQTEEAYSTLEIGVLRSVAAKRRYLRGKIEDEGEPDADHVQAITKGRIRRPIIVDRRYGNYCVEGRHRLTVSLKTGEPLPVVYLS